MNKFRRRVIALAVTTLLALPGVALAGSLESPDARLGLSRPAEYAGTVTDVFVSGGGCGGGGSLWVELKGADGVFYVPLSSFDRTKLGPLGLNAGDTVTAVGYRETVKDEDTEYVIVTPVALKAKDLTVKPQWAGQTAAASMMSQGPGMMSQGSGMMGQGTDMMGMMRMMGVMNSEAAESTGCGGTSEAADQPAASQSAPAPAAPASQV